MKYRLLLFPFFFLAYEFIGNLSNDMYLPAFLQISKSFSTDHNSVQASITAWFGGVCLAQILLGPLCDRFGRRIVLIIGGLIFLLSTIGCAAAPNIDFLIFSRLFQGFGAGSILIAGYASIHALYHDPHKATLLLAWASSIAVTSPMIGPILGSYVLLGWDWRGIFWVIFIGVLIPFFCTSLILPESLKPEEKHSLHPVALGRTYSKALRARGFTTRSLTFGLICSGTILWVTAAPYLIMSHFGYSPQAFAYLQAVVPAGYIIGAQSMRFFLKYFSRDELIQRGLLLSLSSALFILLSSFFFEQTVYPLLIGMTFYAFGFGAIGGPLQKEAILSTSIGKGMATSLIFVTMAGINTFVSFMIAVLPDSLMIAAIILTLIIGTSFATFQVRNRKHYHDAP